ncbi:hypothetical protein Hamer_G006187 [Homarus americanus]|uniref:Uncharacterized protein n=1 Tax=Homarus americanus TaxID=6706 RepID=A0A8J5MM11_HOMAM|nr:hypothetical protein Hamer_G006187 [Homarus americanus]
MGTIQWNWPENYGEEKFIMILGGLHIEMAALRMAGSWSQGSGWAETLVQADIASPGTANSFLKAAHVTRTRRSHQITAATLNILQPKAYGKYTKDAQSDDHEPLDFDKSKPLGDTNKLNKLTLFSSMKSKSPTRSKQHLAFAKDDCGLFSRLYKTCQTREGDLDEFLKHENRAYPPELSSGGKFHFSKKAHLLTPLEQLADKIIEASHVTSTILDGPAVVEMLKPGGSTVFQEYSTAVFIPYIESQLEYRSRLDLQLENFLRNSDNKEELFSFLSEQVMQLAVKERKQLFVTDKKQVLTVPPRKDTANLAPCNHEEADTRMMVHAADALECGHRRILIRTVDTYVVILGVALANERSHSKKAALATRNAFPEVTTAFLSLASTTSELPDGVLSTLERFIVLFYYRTSTCCEVNVLRKKLFSRKSRSLEDLPPTRAALE